jgi:hypothetical protein
MTGRLKGPEIVEAWLTRQSVQAVMLKNCFLEDAQRNLLRDPLIQESLEYLWHIPKSKRRISMATSEWISMWRKGGEINVC